MNKSRKSTALTTQITSKNPHWTPTLTDSMCQTMWAPIMAKYNSLAKSILFSTNTSPYWCPFSFWALWCPVLTFLQWSASFGISLPTCCSNTGRLYQSWEMSPLSPQLYSGWQNWYLTFGSLPFSLATGAIPNFHDLFKLN